MFCLYRSVLFYFLITVIEKVGHINMFLKSGKRQDLQFHKVI